MSHNLPIPENLYQQISQLLKQAQANVVRVVNTTMVTAYYQIGRLIVEEEQGGEERAGYGKFLLKELSAKLTQEFGKGFSQRNLEQMRQFYLVYSKTQTVSAEFRLSWSHYLNLMRIDDEQERRFYEIEAAKQNWSIRELQRQYDSALYTRLALSRDKEKVLELAEKGQVIEKPSDAIKDPYILEFLGLPERTTYSESDLGRN